MKHLLLTIFKELNDRIEAENNQREANGTLKVTPVEIKVLGQATLLANEMVAQILPLQMTQDLDAQITPPQGFVKELLEREILPKHGLVLDSDSDLVWIPPNSRFELLDSFRYVKVTLLDPESALVSKAVMAKEKNKALIVDATASQVFPKLVERIEANKGDLEYFLKEEE